ncbi:unnamed protein product [Rotaria socialis]|uniref:Uncharacterized protein n=2 Tax=Rotaria socialis TaxID=392032 RepID=A0A817VR58_9BILA|nr:unnamed protein product [Rotaria socialis]
MNKNPHMKHIVTKQFKKKESQGTLKRLIDKRMAIRHAQLLPSLPPVIFKRDNFRVERDQINHLLDTADKGSLDETSISTNSTERNDLYDSDRTVILRKLSNQTLLDEDKDEASVDT